MSLSPDFFKSMYLQDDYHLTQKTKMDRVSINVPLNWKTLYNTDKSLRQSRTVKAGIGRLVLNNCWI